MPDLGMGGHSLPGEGATDDWLTPPHILQDLGPFDLDPCSSIDQPWETATNQMTILDDGLYQPWDGLVWCNPPYGRETWGWLEKLSAHDMGGIALIFARTETKGFYEQVWSKASAILFLKGRLHFHHPKTGEKSKHNSGAPSALVGYGPLATNRLFRSGLEGAYLDEWNT